MSKVPFFIMSIPRSGSTWFLSLLNGQHRVSAYEELFYRPAVTKYHWEGSPPRFDQRRGELRGSRPRQIERYLQEIEDFAEDGHAFGFKVMIRECWRHAELLPLLVRRRYRLVCFVRDNAFAGAVSRLALAAGHEAHATEPGSLEMRLRLDPEVVVREIRKHRLGIRILHTAARLWPWPSMVVHYEALLEHQPETMQDILSLLGSSAPAVTVQSSLKKRVVVPYDTLIENAAEVAAYTAKAGLGSALPKELLAKVG